MRFGKDLRKSNIEINENLSINIVIYAVADHVTMLDSLHMMNVHEEVRIA